METIIQNRQYVGNSENIFDETGTCLLDSFPYNNKRSFDKAAQAFVEISKNEFVEQTERVQQLDENVYMNYYRDPMSDIYAAYDLSSDIYYFYI